jgi:glycosyltransferase involved in cell wall biosynthesis
MKLSIIVPCYNEADNLSRLIAAFRSAIGDRTGVELVLVNNGSTDNSASVLDAQLACPENAFARSVLVPKNQGYGWGILCGLRAARGEAVAWTHADLQTDPADVLAGYDLFLQQPDQRRTFLRGKRRGRPAIDRLFTGGMSVVATLALGSRLHDVNAQPKLFHRDLLPRLDDAPWDFSLDLFVLHLANRLQLNVVELAVDFGKRMHGTAKGGGSLHGKYKLTLRTWRYIVALRRTLKQQANGKALSQMRRAA